MLVIQNEVCFVRWAVEYLMGKKLSMEIPRMGSFVSFQYTDTKKKKKNTSGYVS